MPGDHYKSSAQHVPFQAFVLAPMFAPLSWLLAAVATNLYGRGLSLAAFGMKFLFMLLLLLGSYVLSTPLLHIWASLARKPQKSKYAGFVVAAIAALILGTLYAQPRFQDARHSTQNLVYLAYMLLTSLGMFMSLQNLFSSPDHTPSACLEWLNKRSSVWGLLSIFKGVLALLIMCSATYANLLPQDFHFSRLFDISVSHGELAEEAYAASIFDINPGHFFQWCFYSSVILAVAAMASALQAKIREEDSLYRATGCICGVLALAVFDPTLAFIAGLAYSLASYSLALIKRE